MKHGFITSARRAGSGVLLASVALTLAACGSSEDKMYKVSGTVTIDGAPLKDGQVKFMSQDAKFEIFDVKGGKFEGEAREGERKVEVYAYREVTDKAATAMYGSEAEESKENYIPDAYNTNSKLTAKVTPDGLNEFKFDVSAKK